MNKADYRASLLKAYSCMSDMIEQAEFRIYNKAIGTHNFCNVNGASTYDQVAEIVKLINRKNVILDIKNSITKSLNDLQVAERNLLIFRNIKKFSTTKVAQKYGLSKGAYYSKLNSALNNFENNLVSCGIDYAWFCVNYAEHIWFKKLINNCNGLTED